MTAATLPGLQFFKSNFANVMPQWLLPIGAGIATGVVYFILGLRMDGCMLKEFCFVSDYAGNGSFNSV
jgi:hypothetical protein